jgi:hypothetical protein
MDILRVYGKKDGKEEKLLFATLDASCKATAKKTIAQHGYKVTRVIKAGQFENGYKEEDVTGEW